MATAAIRLRPAYLTAALAASFGQIASAGAWEDAKAAYAKQDYVAAARLLRAAAAERNPDAQQLLGFMYHDGQGVTRDYILSDMWFRLAKSLYAADSQDFRDASDALSLTEKQLTSAGIEKARTLAGQCQARQYSGCAGDPGSR